MYPPGLAVLMLGFRQVGLPPLIIARLVDGFLYPCFLFAVWFAFKRMAGARVAFFSLLIFSSSYGFYVSSTTLPAFTLAVLWAILAMARFADKNVTAAGWGTALCFYTHDLAALWFVLSLLLFGLMDRDQMKPALTLLAIALFLASPFLAFQFLNRDYFTAINLVDNQTARLDLGIGLLALYGASLAVRGRTAGRLWLGCFGATLILFLAFPNYRARFLEGPVWAVCAGLAALALDRMYAGWTDSKRAFKTGPLLVVLIGLFFYFLAPVMAIDFNRNSVKVEFFKRSLMHYLKPGGLADSDPKDRSIYFSDAYREIAKVAVENSHPDDILWSNFSYAGGIVGLLADRALSSAMLPEVKPAHFFDPLSSAKILIWFKDRSGLPPKEAAKTAELRRLRPLAETNYALIYENPQAEAKRQVPKPLVSTVILLPAVLGIFLFAFVIPRRT